MLQMSHPDIIAPVSQLTRCKSLSGLSADVGLTSRRIPKSSRINFQIAEPA